MHVAFWLLITFIFSVAFAPMLLLLKYQKKDVRELFNIGLKAEGVIISYERRRSRNATYIYTIFEFTPIGREFPVRFSKVGYINLKNHPVVGSSITVFYNKKFPIMSVIDFYGDSQMLMSEIKN